MLCYVMLRNDVTPYAVLMDRTASVDTKRGPSPQELVKQASLAARLQDLDIIRLEAGMERREPAQWDELRVWDPGDG